MALVTRQTAAAVEQMADTRFTQLQQVTTGIVPGCGFFYHDAADRMYLARQTAQSRLREMDEAGVDQVDSVYDPAPIFEEGETHFWDWVDCTEAAGEELPMVEELDLEPIVLDEIIIVGGDDPIHPDQAPADNSSTVFMAVAGGAALLAGIALLWKGR